MTDFRRPDLDLWEEEEDVDDARPTIVAERPTLENPNAQSLALAHEKAQRASSNPGRSALVDRLIAQGALEDEQLGRPSVESLRNSEVDELTVIEKEPFAAAYAARAAEIAQVESEPATEDAVPTVSVRRPLPASNTPLPKPSFTAAAAAGALPSSGTPLPGRSTLPASGTPLPGRAPLTSADRAPLPASVTPHPGRAPLPASPTPLPRIDPAVLAEAEAREAAERAKLPSRAEREVTERIAVPGAASREVTERISIPSGGMAGSIAPATRTQRPSEGARKAGLPVWQTALAAVVLLGGGLGLAKLRNDRQQQVSATSIAAPRPLDSAPTAVAPTPVEPPPAIEPPPAVVEPSSPSDSRLAEAPVVPAAVPVQQVPSAAPEPVLPPPPRTEEPANAVRRARPVRPERRALAAAEPAEPSEPSQPVAAPAEPSAPASDLPAQPSRDQVTAALNAVLPELQKCVGDRHDTANVTVTVRPAGFVSYAVVSGPYAGSPEGSCIARAVKGAKFPAFSDPSLRVTYPYQL